MDSIKQLIDQHHDLNNIIVPILLTIFTYL